MDEIRRFCETAATHFFLLLNAFTKQTSRSTGTGGDEAPIPARLWALSPQEEHGEHPLYLRLPSPLWSLSYLRKQGLLITWIGWKRILNCFTNTTVTWSQWNYGPIVLFTKLHERVTRIGKASSDRYLLSFGFIPGNVSNFPCQNNALDAVTFFINSVTILILTVLP